MTRNRGLVSLAVLLLALPVFAEPVARPESAPLRSGAAAPVRALVHAGPMLGYASLREASVWVQTTTDATVELRYWPEGAAETLPAQLRPSGGGEPPALPPGKVPAGGSLRLQAQASGDHIVTFVLSGLEPNTRYGYELTVDGRPVPAAAPRSFRTQALWRHRTEAPDFTAMIGSCLYVNDPPYDRPGTPYGSEHEILLAMAQQKPDLMVWLGDNTYLREVDFDTPEGVRYRYRHDRALPELQPLLAATRHYATWDDHDFGPNDSDASYPLKDVALDVFRRYWPAPTLGLPGVPGVFQKFSWSDVDFFLMDDRSHRKPNKWPAGPDRRMLGAAQLSWLKESLVASDATFKVVVVGNQVLNRLARFEGLSLYPVEHDDLLGFLRIAKVEGVLFLSGDVHHSELIKVQPEGLYPLYDFSSSPLTAGIYMPREGTPDFAHPDRVPGTLLGEHSFGTLRVDGGKGARRITLRAHDKAGAVKWSHTIEHKELAFPK